MKKKPDGETKRFVVMDESIIAAGDFIFGSVDLIEQITRSVASNKRILAERISEIYGSQIGDDEEANYNYLTKEVTVRKRNQPPQ